MSGSKHLDKIAWIATAVVLIIAILLMNGGALGIQAASHTMGYENRLFDNSRVHTIDITMENWDEFIQAATQEVYYAADVVIDGERYNNVGIRGKGNTSLSTVATLGSQRYSFKLEFDQYDNSITYHGLDKLSLNNLIQDATMMKDYLTFTMMKEFGADTPLCSFVYITVNGEDWGLYLAVEGLEDSFLERMYGNDHGHLYKPDTMTGDRDMSGSASGEMSLGGIIDTVSDWVSSLFGGSEDESSTDGASGEMSTAESAADRWNSRSSASSEISTEESSAGEASSGEVTAEESASDWWSSRSSASSELSAEESTADEASADESVSDWWSSRSSASSELSTEESPADDASGDEAAADESASGEASASERWSRSESAADESSSDEASTDESASGEASDSSSSREMSFSDMFGGGGGFGMGSSDVKLQYIDDNISSYSNIWNNAKTDITTADQTRLIESLKKLSAYEDIESVVNVEQVIRYFVVHNYVCNGDSYTGTIIHNYYLYEEDGQLTILPWDYNLAFGSFSGSNATNVVNTPIDRPISGGSSDRPMLHWIYQSEEYTEMYHEYYEEFLATVDVQGLIEQAYQLISPYVAKDPTAFYTYEEFELGVETMRQYCALRSESISMQLETGETTSDQSYADASGIDLSDMGSMSNSGGGGDDRWPSRSSDEPEEDSASAEAESDGSDSAEDESSGEPNTAEDDSSGETSAAEEGSSGELSSSEEESSAEADSAEDESSAEPAADEDTAEESSGEITDESSESGASDEADSEDASSEMSSRASGEFSFSRSSSSNTGVIWTWIGVSAAVLILGLVAAKLYGRRR